MTTDLATRPEPDCDEAAALRLVDNHLGLAARRGAFTRPEAEDALRLVCATVCDATTAAEITAIVDGALASFGAERIIARERVADALLDIRLALTAAGSVVPAS